jgi:hypothetical protein
VPAATKGKDPVLLVDLQAGRKGNILGHGESHRKQLTNAGTKELEILSQTTQGWTGLLRLKTDTAIQF